jgi:hypothetical protein
VGRNCHIVIIYKRALGEIGYYIRYRKNDRCKM